jgi:nicotinamide-nucleotide amidase
LVEEAIGEKVLAIPGVELGYCARPGDVDVRIVGEPGALERADTIITGALRKWIYSVGGEDLEEVLVKLLAARTETLAVAESCTGGLLAHRITNVPGASDVFVAGYVTYANETKIDILHVDQDLIERHGAVSEAVARAMAEGAQACAASTYALATTGVAGPSGGSPQKPVGTVFLALAAANSETMAKKFFYPSDRETFKELATQAGLDLLRGKLLQGVTASQPSN